MATLLIAYLFSQLLVYFIPISEGSLTLKKRIIHFEYVVQKLSKFTSKTTKEIHNFHVNMWITFITP